MNSVGCLGLVSLMVAGIFAGFLGFSSTSEMIIPPDEVTVSTIDYASIPQNRTEDGAFVLGNPDAAVTVVAFEDFLCPHCQNYQPTVHAFIMEHVVTGEARFEFRMLPISQQSFFVFGLVECAEIESPGSFWYAHDAMFNLTTEQGFNLDGNDFASAMDISADELLECTETATQYQADQALAGEYSEITGTPSLAWRLNDGELRLDVIPRQPTPEQLTALVDEFSQ